MFFFNLTSTFHLAFHRARELVNEAWTSGKLGTKAASCTSVISLENAIARRVLSSANAHAGALKEEHLVHYFRRQLKEESVRRVAIATGNLSPTKSLIKEPRKLSDTFSFPPSPIKARDEPNDKAGAVPSQVRHATSSSPSSGLSSSNGPPDPKLQAKQLQVQGIVKKSQSRKSTTRKVEPTARSPARRSIDLGQDADVNKNADSKNADSKERGGESFRTSLTNKSRSSGLLSGLASLATGALGMVGSLVAAAAGATEDHTKTSAAGNHKQDSTVPTEIHGASRAVKNRKKLVSTTVAETCNSVRESDGNKQSVVPQAASYTEKNGSGVIEGSNVRKAVKRKDR